MQLRVISAPLPTRAGGKRLRQSAWIALFTLGLCFWIPALLRAKLGASAVTGNPAVEGQPSWIAGAAGPVGPALDPSATIVSSVSTGGCRATPTPSSPLIVTTTILGKTRRAALVNGRLYREGDRIVAASELYRLASVKEDRVELVSLAPCAGAKRSVMLRPTPDSDRAASGSH